MRTLKSLVAIAVLAGAGLSCSRTKSSPAGDEDRAGASSEVRAGSPSSDWPIIELEGDEVRLDGKVTGTTRHVSDLGRMQKIDELFTALKERREKWKQQHPDEEFPGVCGIRVAGGVSMIVFKSVFQTAAYAGYPFLSVQPIDDADTIVNLNAQIPGPPRPAEEDVGGSPREQRLHLYLADAEVTLTRKEGLTVVAETKIQRDPKDVQKAACEDWKAWGKHTEKTDARRDAAVVHVDDRMVAKDTLPLIAAIRGCTREREGQATPIAAFDVAFSVR